MENVQNLFHGFSVILSWYNLGMMAVGLRLVKADDWDAKLGMGTIVLRAVASTILFQITLLNVINGLMAAFTAKKQTLGDMIARTQVLKVR